MGGKYSFKFSENNIQVTVYFKEKENNPGQVYGIKYYLGGAFKACAENCGNEKYMEEKIQDKMDLLSKNVDYVEYTVGKNCYKVERRPPTKKKK